MPDLPALIYQQLCAERLHDPLQDRDDTRTWDLDSSSPVPPRIGASARAGDRVADLDYSVDSSTGVASPVSWIDERATQ